MQGDNETSETKNKNHIENLYENINFNIATHPFRLTFCMQKKWDLSNKKENKY